MELKANKKPIGGLQKEQERVFEEQRISFAEHEIMLYMFSDGYQDQFGGAENRKFMIRRLKEVFASIHHQPLKAQREHLYATFLEWKGGYQQIDDVLIMGMRLK